MLSLNPWFHIWVHPKETVRKIISFNPYFRIWILAAVFGFVSLMFLEQIYSPGYRFSLLSILLFSILAAPFWGYFLFTSLSWLVYVTGKLIGSKGGFTEICTVTAWSSVPYVINMACWIVMIVVFKKDLFTDFPAGKLLESLQINLILTLSALKLGMTIWSIVIYIQALSFVQELSIAKTLLNILLAAFIISVVLGILWIAIAGTCGNFFDVPLITFRI